jgi:hypothetical protein
MYERAGKMVAVGHVCPSKGLSAASQIETLLD